MPQDSPGYVFVSYSRTDNDVMRRIVAFLSKRGIKTWLDNERLVPGTPIWEEEIEKAIKSASAIVVVLSPDSKISEWVRREISLADQNRKRIFPVLVRGDEDTSVTLRLITRQYVDLRKNEEAGLDSLYSALSQYSDELKNTWPETQESPREKTEQLATKGERRLSRKTVLVLGAGGLFASILVLGIIFFPEPPEGGPETATTSIEETSQGCPTNMVLIPAGEFILGALDIDTDAEDNEKPARQIYLDAYCIDRTEVSNEAYADFMESLGRLWERNELPAVNVTWQEAIDYCNSLGRRLPTEYQWEKSARGTDGRKFPWMGKEDFSKANVENFQYNLHPVGDFEEGASPYGVLNLSGNVAEWTMDWYDSDWYQSIPDFGKNPIGPFEPGEMGTIVVRGGSLGDLWKNARTTTRLGTIKPDETRDYLGFRCASIP